MLRVTVEMLPGGDEHRKRQLGRIEIANLSDLADVSDYAVGADIGGERCTTEITKHRRSDGWMPLLVRVLAKLSKRG